MRFKLSLLAMVTMLGVASAAVAAQPQREPQSIEMQDDRDEGGMDLGWLGLIGLSGLLGLKRSSEAPRRTTVGDHSPSVSR